MTGTFWTLSRAEREDWGLLSRLCSQAKRPWLSGSCGRRVWWLLCGTLAVPSSQCVPHFYSMCAHPHFLGIVPTSLCLFSSNTAKHFYPFAPCKGWSPPQLPCLCPSRPPQIQVALLVAFPPKQLGRGAICRQKQLRTDPDPDN